MKKKLKNKKWVYLIGGFVALLGLVVAWLLRTGTSSKPCECESSSDNSIVDKGSLYVPLTSKIHDSNLDVLEPDLVFELSEIKEILVSKGNSGCGC